MKARRIFVYGAGGHGKVVADALLSRGEGEFAGFVDDREEMRGRWILGWPVCGDGEWLKREAARGPVAVALGVGDNYARKMLAERCAAWGVEMVTVAHATAAVSKAAGVGCGTVVLANAVVNAEAQVGAGVIVNSGAVVEHDVVIGDYSHVAPNATMGGSARVGAMSHVGLGAAVLPGVQVGSHTIVGAGAVVTRNIGDHVVAVGVPARVRREVEPAGLMVVARESNE